MDITTALAASRLMAQQRAMDVTANNIANANTPGYRTERVQFSDFVDTQSGAKTPAGVKTISYTQDRATYRESQLGAITHTGNPYDLALTGEGYFTVNTKNGPRLTRDGRFGLMPDGTVADSSGNAVLDTMGKPIQIPPDDTQVSIASDGSVSTENGQVGKIGVVQSDPMKMQAEGATNFVANAPTKPVASPGIVQGAMEESNVQPVLEVTRMMDNERQFQFVTQLVQAEGDRQQSSIEKLLPAASGSECGLFRYVTKCHRRPFKMRSLDIAGTGMQAQQTNVEVISNNMANMTTTGYKRRRAEFQDLIYQNLRRVGSNSSDSGTVVPAGAQVGLGVKTAAIYPINEQGNLQQTSNTLDLAIQGNGYFQVTLPDGETAYTRDGTFALGADGTIVTADGFTVQPGLQIPTAATGVTINTSGQVQVTLQGQTAPQTIGQLQLATFPNSAGLDAQGANLFLQTAASGAPVTGNPATAGFGSVEQGFIETSNVNVVTEITNLITAQRAYEMNSKVITSSDEMMSTLTNLR